MGKSSAKQPSAEDHDLTVAYLCDYKYAAPRNKIASEQRKRETERRDEEVWEWSSNFWTMMILAKIIRPSLQLITRTTYPPNTTHIIDDNLTFNS